MLHHWLGVAVALGLRRLQYFQLGLLEPIAGALRPLMRLQTTHEVGEPQAAIALNQAPLLQLPHHKLLLRVNDLFGDEIGGDKLRHSIDILNIYRGSRIRM